MVKASNLLDPKAAALTSGNNFDEAQSTLRNAENQALSQNTDSFLNGSQDRIQARRGFYQGQGRSEEKSKGFIARYRKQLAVFGIIAALVGGGGAFLGSSHSMLMPAIETLLTEATDTQFASMALRSLNLTGFRSRRAAGFFDNASQKFLARIGISKNAFKDATNSPDEDTNKRNLSSTMDDVLEDSGAVGRHKGSSEEEVEENGERKVVDAFDEDSVDTTTIKNDADTPRTKATALANSFAGSAQRVADTLSIPCMALQVATMVSGTIAAYEIYQSIEYAMSFLENFSKTRAGDGNNAYANTILNEMTTSYTVSIDDYSSRNTSGTEVSEKEVSGAGTQEEGMLSILTYSTADPTKTSDYSYGRAMPALLSKLNIAAGTAITTQKTCAFTNAAGSLASLAISFIPGGGIAKVVGSFVTKKAVLGAAVTFGISAALSFIIPTLAKVFFTNYMENAIGVPGMAFLTRGAASVNTLSGQVGSAQMPASRDKIIAYNRVNNQVLAMEAEEDRQKYSPFDIRSKNTFFGSLFYSFLPSVLNRNNNTALSAFANTAKTSLANLISNGVYADGEGSSFMTTFNSDEECQMAASVNAAGNLYCDTERITDSSTLGMSLDEARDKIIELGGLECNGEKCTVVKDSNFARFISYCKNRYSPFGTIDSNILSDFSPAKEGISSILSYLPIINELEDLFTYGNTVMNDGYGWASGELCVISDENSMWDEENKYYQRFIEDLRVLQQSSAFDDESYEEVDDPITPYEEEYAAAHPIENSPAGYLSTIAGITTSDAELVLAMAEYGQFLAEYDVDSREVFSNLTTAFSSAEIVAQIESSLIHFDDRMFGSTGLPSSDSQFSSDEYNHESTDAIILVANSMIYADLRGRTYTV